MSIRVQLNELLVPYTHVLAIALALGWHGARKGSLNESGAVAATFLGWLTLANPNFSFGTLLLAFYFIGSRATKVNADIKATLEREAVPNKPAHKGAAPHKSATGGQRNATQVMCNALLRESGRTAPACQSGTDIWLTARRLDPAGIVAFAYRINFGFEEVLKPYVWASATRATAERIQNSLFTSDPALLQSPLLQLGRFCLLFTLGHYAACMGDTLASELGILATGRPRLITNLTRTVPPGTNGGVSAWGTACSVMGGAGIGLTLAISERLRTKGQIGASINMPVTGKLVLLGAAAGFGGSMLDSLLGATLQRTWYSKKTKQVLLGSAPPAADPKEEWEVVSGSSVLSNNTVNLISSAVTGLAIAMTGYYVF